MADDFAAQKKQTSGVPAKNAASAGDRALFESLVEHSAQGMVIVQHGAIVYANPAVAHISGYPVEALTAATPQEFLNLIFPDDRVLLQQTLHKLRRSPGRVLRYEIRIIHKNGSTRWLAVSAASTTFNGAPATQGTIIDLTAHKRDEKKRWENEIRYRSIVDLLPTPLVIFSAEKIVFINSAAVAALGGNSFEEFAGESVFSIVHPGFRDVVRRAFSNQETDTQLATKFICVDGRTIDVELTWNFVDYSENPASQIVFRDVTARRQLERQLAAIHRLGRRLTLLRDETSIAQRVLDTAANVLNFESAGCGLVNAHSGQLVYRNYIVGGRPLSVAQSLPLTGPDARGIGVEVVQTARAIYVPDTSKDSRHVPLSADLPARSELSVPMDVGGKVLGVLTATSLKPNHFSPADQQLLQTLADQAAVAVENARLYDRLQLWVQELATMNEVNNTVSSTINLEERLNILTDYITRLLNVEAAALVLKKNPNTDTSPLVMAAVSGPNADSVHGKQLKWGHGIVGWVIEHGEPLMLPDAGDDSRFFSRFDQESGFETRSVLCIPLQVKGRTIGAIEGLNKNSGFFELEDLRLLNLLATPAATAIENARLYEEIENYAGELEAQVTARTRDLATLYDVTAVASDEALNLQLTLNRALERVLLALDAEAGVIQLPADGGKTLHVAAQRGFSAEVLAHFNAQPAAEGLAGWVFESAQSLVISKLDQHPLGADVSHTSGYMGYAGTVMRARGKVEGVLGVFKKTSPKFNVEDVALLSSVADHLGVAAENARLQRQAEQAAILEERERLARDLHDSVTQSLYSLTLFAEAARALSGSNQLEQLQEYLTDIGDTANQALKEMRLMLYELRPPLLEAEGLVEALRRRFDAVEGRTGVKGRVVTDSLVRLPPNAEVGLYRIAQEALNNALKHADATEVTVRISTQPNVLTMEITDNGQGFDVASAHNSGGLGLTSMQQRAHQLGATFAILSGPATGTTVQIQVELSTLEHPLEAML